MKLIQMKCPSCGASLKVKADCNSVKCEFCGITTMIDDEKIVVEHKFKNTSFDTMYENAFVYLNKLKKYDEAKDLLLKLSKIKPGESKIWEGIILAETEHFDTNCYVDEDYILDYEILEDALENYTLTEEDEEKKKKFKEKYINYIKMMEERIDLISKDKYDQITHNEAISKIAIIAVLIGVFIVFLSIIGSASNNNDGEIKHVKSTKEKIQEYYYHFSTVDCSYFADGIMDFDYEDKVFITKDKMYEFITSGLFSNNQQCREIITLDEQKMKLVGNFKQFDHRSYKPVIITEKGYVCSIPDLECKEDYASNDILPYLENNLVGHDYQFVFRETQNGTSDNKGLLFIYEPQELYYVMDFYYNYNGGTKFQKIDLIFDEDEEIIRVGKNVVTNKGFYYVKEYISNYEECNKYVDIPCESKYGLFKLKRLSSLYNELYFVGRYIVDKEGNIYSGNSNR